MSAIEVDLLSDTVTRPTRAMRQFMCEAYPAKLAFVPFIIRMYFISFCPLPFGIELMRLHGVVGFRPEFSTSLKKFILRPSRKVNEGTLWLQTPDT